MRLQKKNVKIQPNFKISAELPILDNTEYYFDAKFADYTNALQKYLTTILEFIAADDKSEILFRDSSSGNGSQATIERMVESFMFVDNEIAKVTEKM